MFKGKKYKKLFNLETENNPSGTDEVSTAKGATSNSQRYVDFDIFCVMPSGVSSQDDPTVATDRGNASTVEKNGNFSTILDVVSAHRYGNTQFDLKEDEMDLQNNGFNNWGNDTTSCTKINECNNVNTTSGTSVTMSEKQKLYSTLEGIFLDDCDPDHELECLLDEVENTDSFQSSPLEEEVQCNSDCPLEDQVDMQTRNIVDSCNSKTPQDAPFDLSVKEKGFFEEQPPLISSKKVTIKSSAVQKSDWDSFNTLLDSEPLPQKEQAWFAWRDKAEDVISIPKCPPSIRQKKPVASTMKVPDGEFCNTISNKPRKSLSEDNLSFLSSSNRIGFPSSFNNSSVIANCFKIDRKTTCHYTDISSAASILTSAAAALPGNARLQAFNKPSPQPPLSSKADLIASLDDLKLLRFEQVRDDSGRPKQNFDRMKRLLSAFRPNLRYSSLDKTSRREKGIPTEALNISLVDVYKFSRQYLETLSESKIRDSERYEARRMAVCEDRDDSRDDFLYLLRMYLQRRHLMEYQYL